MKRKFSEKEWWGLGIILFLLAADILNTYLRIFKSTRIVEIIIVAGAVVIFWFIAPIWDKISKKRLQERGLKIEADFDRVASAEDDKGIREYIIVAKAKNPKTGQLTEYYSDSLKANPKKYLPSKITIVVDAEKLSNYEMDLSFLKGIKPGQDNGQ